MDILEIMKMRHSMRQYNGKKIEKGKDEVFWRHDGALRKVQEHGKLYCA